MSTDEDTELRDLVAETLEVNGVLNKIRAELRANVFLALEEHDTLHKKSVSNKALKNFLNTNEGHQIFSLVREFLQFFNLDFTLAVLDPEADYVGKESSRDNLMNEMNLLNVDHKSPLLVEAVKKKNEGRVSPTSPKHGSKIPQRIHDPKSQKSNSKSKDPPSYNEKRSLITAENDSDEDDLLKELGVSPISYEAANNNKKKMSWLTNDPLSKSSEKKKQEDKSFSGGGGGLGSLKNAPPLPGLGGKNKLETNPLDINSPEWDDIMKIDKKIDELGFSIPKDTSASYNNRSSKDNSTSYNNNKSTKDSEYNYEDDFMASNSQKSDGLSITEEIEDDISIGSFAGSKADDLLTTDQTVSQVSGDGFDYGEDAEF